MKIDNRLLLPFVMPFVLLGFIRFFWLVAGGDWSFNGLAALTILTSGALVGIVCMIAAFEDGVSLGQIKLPFGSCGKDDA